VYELKAPDKLPPVVILARNEAIPYLHRVMVARVTPTFAGSIAKFWSEKRTV
jgi:hypothetical protein